MNMFEKVSFNQFKKDLFKWYPSIVNVSDIDNKLKELYDDIKLPERATSDSAGYDFFLPFDISLDLGGVMVIPSGIRCNMDKNLSLKLYPRSGHGFKYHLVFANTIGVVDADYYNSDNEGHIMIEIIYNGFNYGKNGFIKCGRDGDVINDFCKCVIPEHHGILDFKKGSGICQGIFEEYKKVDNDNATGIRNGGFGSTNR